MITDRLQIDRTGRTFQITDDNVSPFRYVGTDENGLPREETVCMLAKHELMVDRKGNIRDVPLSTGRVPSSEPEAERYEMQTRIGLIRDGWLPLAECPHTQEYRRHTNRDHLVEPADGVKQCGGEPGGCSHLKPIIKARAQKARAEFDAQQTNTQNMTPAQIASMAEALGAGIASQLGSAQRGKSALRDGRGEKDEK